MEPLEEETYTEALLAVQLILSGLSPSVQAAVYRKAVPARLAVVSKDVVEMLKESATQVRAAVDKLESSAPLPLDEKRDIWQKLLLAKIHIERVLLLAHMGE